jgi:hypothetical protein
MKIALILLQLGPSRPRGLFGDVGDSCFFRLAAESCRFCAPLTASPVAGLPTFKLIPRLRLVNNTNLTAGASAAWELSCRETAYRWISKGLVGATDWTRIDFGMDMLRDSTSTGGKCGLFLPGNLRSL